MTFNTERTGEAKMCTKTTANLGDSQIPKPHCREVNIGTNGLESGGNGATAGGRNDGASMSGATHTQTRAVVDEGPPVECNFNAVAKDVEVVHVPETPEPPKSSQTEPESQEFSFSKVIL